MRETWVQSLGQEDPLEKEMVIHSNILAWENPMDRGTWWVAVHGIAESQICLQFSSVQSLSCVQLFVTP